jgi:hypothetical protein
MTEMSYSKREEYQYDFKQKVLTYKSIGAEDRKGVVEYLLTLHQYLKREVSFLTKYNPDLRINKLFNIDLPPEALVIDESFIWNESDWNDDKYWNALQPGINFNINTLWRVIEIKRSLDGKNMSVKGKIYNIKASEF